MESYGDPRNPPIVFLHGIRLGGKIWEPHARELCEDYYVLTPDLPGHGIRAGEPFAWEQLRALLDEITGSLRCPPLLVGYSLGGYVAMRYGAEYPERTCALLLTGCTTDIVGVRQTLYEISVGLTAQFSEAFIQKVLRLFFRVTLPPQIAAVVIPFRFNQRVFEQSRALVTGVRFSERLAAYKKPVLIVNGQWDILFRPDEQLFANACQTQAIVMRNLDHVAPLRRAHEFTQLVRTFAQATFEGPRP